MQRAILRTTGILLTIAVIASCSPISTPGRGTGHVCDSCIPSHGDCDCGFDRLTFCPCKQNNGNFKCRSWNPLGGGWSNCGGT
jgi:hypothetical protein